MPDVPDLSEFLSVQAKKGPQCSVCIALDRMTDEQRAKFDAALAATKDITAATIAKVVEAWGFRVNPQKVSEHRHGTAACLTR